MNAQYVVKTTYEKEEKPVEYTVKLRPCRSCQTPNTNYYMCASCAKNKRLKAVSSIAAMDYLEDYGLVD